MKNFRFLIPLFLLLLTQAGSALALEKGRDYLVLPTPQPVDTGKKIEVREFFWYGCPHCYSLEPVLTSWLKRKPANVEFIRTPGVAPRWLAHAQAFYAFAALGATDRTHTAFFRAIHEQNRPLDSEAALTQFAGEQGVDAAKFRDAYNSFGVRTSVEKAKRLNQSFQVTSVPMVAVDGKYLTSVTMTGSDAAFLKALDQLVQQATRERGAKPAASAK